MSVTNDETNIYKLENNAWTWVFTGNINSYKIFGTTFLVAGNFPDSFNLRYFQDGTFKPMMKTTYPIQSVLVSGDSLFIEEGNSQYASNEFYWLYNNQKKKINFLFPTSKFIPRILQSPIIIKDKLYTGGIYRNYCCTNGTDSMFNNNWDDLYEVNLKTLETKLIHEGGNGSGDTKYLTCSYKDSLSFTRIYNYKIDAKYFHSCNSHSPNLPFNLCLDIDYGTWFPTTIMKAFKEENDSLFYFDNGILKKWYKGMITAINNDSVGIIVRMDKNREGFFAVDKNGKMFNYNYSEINLGIKEDRYLQYKIYPNPASDKLIIETNESIKSVAIYDCYGKLMFISNAKEINISELSTGIYFIIIDGNTPIKFCKISL